jgi:hypothetical protein
LAGGGIKGGVSYGTTDELGWKATNKPTYSYDFHATALHLLGIDHEKLTFYHNGIRDVDCLKELGYDGVHRVDFFNPR